MPLPKILLENDPRLAAFAHLREPEPGWPLIAGWREWAGLPRLGIARLEAKLDTGARTSALHANSIEPLQRGGGPWVRFDVSGEAESMPWHEAPIVDRRVVRSSNGEAELRFVIRTDLMLAGRTWPVEVTLTNRDRMELPMLIGREAMAGRLLVDADKSWLWGQPVWPPLRSGRNAPPGRPPQGGSSR